MIVALYHLQLLLNIFEPIINIHRVHIIRKGWWLSALKISEPIPQRWCHLGLYMQVDQGLLHGLKHLCLHSQHLLKSKRRGWRRVGFLVIAFPIIFSILGGDTVPCVDHLNYVD
jgi:hypothetical protein